MINTVSPVVSPPLLLGPGEIIKSSGKFPSPAAIPGKIFCKDEVVIRNSDSGKGKIINFLLCDKNSDKKFNVTNGNCNLVQIKCQNCY